MELIRVTHENIGKEHICCAIANDSDCQVISKKSWLKDRFDEGLVFLKCNVRGKCFIEYIPAEYAWAPVDADGYMYIDCLWVSGKFKGQGYSTLLLDECIKDSKEKGRKGLVILSAKKKMGFLADPKFLKYKGFRAADAANPYFELWYLPFTDDAKVPCFKPYLKAENVNAMEKGFTLYYTSQCPFTAKYVPILADAAKSKGVDFHVVQMVTKEETWKCPCPFTTFSLYYDGEFVTHEILSEKKFEKLIEEKAAEK